MRDPEFEAQLKAHLKSHRVGFTVQWELDPTEFGTDRYVFTKGEEAKRVVIEQVTSGKPVTVEFLLDEHDFGDGNVASISRETQTPWDVLRDVADQLEAEAETEEPITEDSTQ